MRRFCNYNYTPSGHTSVHKKTGSTAGMYYVHTDNLGSLQAISHPLGAMWNSSAYTAWGGQIKLSGTDGITNRGYTGHEHLEPLGLIDMNGRIYDPTLARFLSPDPYIQAPDYTQGFNRYSYCLNNPFKYTDPSGEFLIEAFIIGGMINLAIQGFSGNIDSAGKFFLSFAVGGLSGLVGGAAGQAVSNTIGSIGFIGGGLTGAAAGGAGSFIGSTGNA